MDGDVSGAGRRAAAGSAPPAAVLCERGKKGEREGVRMEGSVNGFSVSWRMDGWMDEWATYIELAYRRSRPCATSEGS